ncbi:MAG: ATP-binding cassette domain-containing protein [Pirellulaceae bacterium]
MAETNQNGWAVELEDVSIHYVKQPVLETLSWRIRQGNVAVVLGPNGCGKSTLLRAVTAYGHYSTGTIRVLGETLGQVDVHSLRRRIGVVDPQLLPLLDSGITARELVATGFRAILTTYFAPPTTEELAAADQILAEAGLADRTNQVFQSMSSGQKTRVWLARALVHAPDLLVLDEPTADLDLLARERLLATLQAMVQRRRELSVLMVTHHLEDILPITSQVLLLRAGQVVAEGSPERVLTSDLITRTFDCPAEVRQHDQRWYLHVSPSRWNQLI